MSLTIELKYKLICSLLRVNDDTAEKEKNAVLEVLRDSVENPVKEQIKEKVKTVSNSDIYDSALARLVSEYIKSNGPASDQEVYDALHDQGQLQRGWTINHVKRVFTKASHKYWQRSDGRWCLRNVTPFSSSHMTKTA